MIRKIKNQDGSGFSDSRIISTQDIFLGTNVTKSLEEYLKNQEDELNQLKKWTKWYVKYGGMGSGGGGGTGVSQPQCNIYIKKGSTNTTPPIKSGNIVSLWGDGTYNITFTIVRGGGHVFLVTWKFGSDIKESSRYINETTSSITFNKYLSGKQTLDWIIYDETLGEQIEVGKATIIPEEFKVETKLLFKDGSTVSKGTQVSYEVVHNKLKGFDANFKAIVSYPVPIYYKIRYRVNNWEKDRWEFIENSDGVFGAPAQEGGDPVITDITIPISFPNLSEESVVGKEIKIEFLYGKNPESLSALSDNTYYFTVVPANGYFIIISSPEGYENSLSSDQTAELEEIKMGNFPFLITLSSGQNVYQQVKVELFLYDGSEFIREAYNDITIQTNTPYPISKTYGLQTAESGLYKIKGSFGTISTEMYFKVQAASLNWSYDLYDNSNIGSNPTHTYYPGNVRAKLNIPVSIFTNETVTVDNINGSPNTRDRFVCIFNLGLQYDFSNDDSVPFAQIWTGETSVTNKLNIYQNKIVQEDTSTDIIKQYYFPKTRNSSTTDNDEGWHLFTLAINYAKDSTDGGARLFEITVFIDGLLEGIFNGTDINSNTGGKTTLSSTRNTYLNITKIILNPQKKHILKINLFDVLITSISDEKNFNIGDSTKGKYKYLLDTYISTYYNRYITEVDPTSSVLENDSITLRDDILDFSFDEYGMPYATSSVLLNMLNDSEDDVVRTIQTPVLILNPVENVFPESIKSSDLDHPFFPNWFLASWPEKIEYEWQKPPSIEGYVYYIPSSAAPNSITLGKPGTKDASSYIITGGEDNRLISFTFSVQGSSTRKYGTKNIELSIKQDSSNSTNLFTPNFSKSDSNSFLPEESFTLKADLVDSSTCNNNSIGDFVNKNTKPLDADHVSARSFSSRCKDHIKNCLTGFPVLVFINITSNDSTYDDRYYFAGIYNFNLGRKSYINLGYYKNVALYNEIWNTLEESPQGSFNVLSIANNNGSVNNFELDPNLVVTEISQGDPHFDFSQYHETVLFAQEDSNPLKKDDSSMFTKDDTLTGNAEGISYAQDILQRAVHQIALSGGFIFEKLKKNFVKIGTDSNNLPYLIHKDGISLNCVSDYKTQYTRVAKDTTYIEISEPGAQGTGDDLINCITYFEPESGGETIIPYVDICSLVEYYVICMCFGMVDSVLKNLEIKTWTPRSSNGHSTIYLAFYDMDTALGIDNSGKEIDYFAFSDFWDINNDSSGSSTKIKASIANIYPDFFNSDSGVTGYDIPSSYLFAIAKYSYLRSLGFTEDDFERFPKYNSYDFTPVNLYSSYRSVSGELRNADYFINKYFNRLKNIPNSIKNLNYRTKYAKLCYWCFQDYNNKVKDMNTGTYSFANAIITDIDKFTGSGLVKKTDWLTSRLKLLDAYFNINSNLNYKIAYPKFYNSLGTEVSIQSSPKGISKEDLTNIITNEISNINWENYLTVSDLIGSTEYYYYPTLSTGVTFDINSAPILSEFIPTAGKKSAFDFNLEIKAPSYTPVIFRSAKDQPQSYLIGDDTNRLSYTLSFKSIGDQDWNLFGSGEFSWIDNFAGFNMTSGIAIKSNNLKEIIFSSNKGNSSSIKPITTGGINLETPNIDKIKINGTASNPLFKTSLEFSNNTNFNRLSEIDLNNSGMSCNYEKTLQIRTLRLEGMVQSSIKLVNLPSLNTVQLNGSKFSLLELSIWDQNISITGNDQNISATNNYKYHNVDITTLTLHDNSNITNPNGIEGVVNGSVKLYNIENLETVNINAKIKELEINSCDKLSIVTISSSIEKIHIKNCSSKANSLTVYVNDKSPIENVINLTGCTNLNEINFTGTSKFTTINIGQKTNVSIPTNGLQNCVDLQYIDNYDRINDTYDFSKRGSYLINGSYCFFNDYKFTLRRCPDDNLEEDNSKKYPNLLFGITTADSTFRLTNKGNSIDLNAVKYFFSNNAAKGKNEIITNINNLFYNQSGIGTSWVDFTCTIPSLNLYTKINTAVRAFYNTGINWWTKELFSFGTGSSVTTLDITSCFFTETTSSDPIYTHVKTNFLANIGTKLKVLEDKFQSASSGGGYYRFYSNDGIELTQIELKNILSPCINQATNSSQLTHLRMFYNIPETTTSGESITVSLEDCFEKFTNLDTISYFMWNMKNITGITYIKNEKRTSCFQACTKLKNIGACFSVNTRESIDLFSLFTRAQWKNITGLFNIALDTFGGTFNCKKYIDFEEFRELTGQKKDENSGAGYYLLSNMTSNPANVFKNCDIINCSESPLLSFGFTSRNQNTTITGLYNTFNNVRAWTGDVSNNNQGRITTKILTNTSDGEWGKSIAYYLKNCASYYGTYANNSINGCIPFNFFDQRNDVIVYNNTTVSKRYFPNVEVNTTFNPISSKEYIYFISSQPRATEPAQPYISNTNLSIEELLVEIREGRDTETEIVDTDSIEKWTTYRPTLSSIDPDNPNNMKIRTDILNRRTIWVLSKSKTSSGEPYFDGGPTCLEEFKTPITLEVRYNTYGNPNKAVISSVWGLFSGTTWTIPYFKYDGGAMSNWYTDMCNNEKAYIKDLEGINEYSFCYTDINCTELDTQYRESTELTDLVVGREGKVSTSSGNDINGKPFWNFQLKHESSIAYPIVSPDFFYGLNQIIDINSIFYSSNAIGHVLNGIENSSNLEGYLPEHLFSYQTVIRYWENWITNCNILPVLITTINTTSYYSFVPRNFITPGQLTSFTGFLNFHIRIPANNEVYYILLTDSIKFNAGNVISFSNTFPRNVTHGDRTGNNGYIIDTHPSREKTNVARGDYNFNLNLIGKYSEDNDGTVTIDNGSIEDISAKWSSVSFNNLISDDLLYVLRGTIFNNSMTLSDILRKYVTTTMFGAKIDNANAVYGINQNFKFPDAGDGFSGGGVAKKLFNVSLSDHCINTSSVDNNENNIAEWKRAFGNNIFYSS